MENNININDIVSVQLVVQDLSPNTCHNKRLEEIRVPFRYRMLDANYLFYDIERWVQETLHNKNLYINSIHFPDGAVVIPWYLFRRGQEYIWACDENIKKNNNHYVTGKEIKTALAELQYVKEHFGVGFSTRCPVEDPVY